MLSRIVIHERIDELEADIEELEEEIEDYDFGSCQYDVVNRELECKYVELSRLKKS